MSKAVVDCILAYCWPGNIRELIKTAEYMLYSSKSKSQVDLSHLPDTLRLNYENLRKSRETNPENQPLSNLSVDQRTREEFSQILKTLRDRKNLVNGRNSLRAALLKTGLSLTERSKKQSSLSKNCE